MKHYRYVRIGAFILGMASLASPAIAQNLDAESVTDLLQQNADKLGLSQTDIADFAVTDQYTDRRTGITHLYVQQRIGGVPVFGAITSLAVSNNGSLLSSSSGFVAEAERQVRSKGRALGAADAVYAVARRHGLEIDEPLTEQAPSRARAALVATPDDVVLSDGGISQQPIGAKLVYLPMEDGSMNLAWMIDIYTEDAAHYYVTFVDAASGVVLHEEDLVVQDNWSTHPAHAEQRLLLDVQDQWRNAPLIPYALPEVVDAPVAALPTDGASYRVISEPFESPGHAGDPFVDQRVLRVDPADPTASPLGWHNDGSTGYTVTRGNNAHAYTDIDANNVADPGSDPDGGAGLVFDFPMNPLAEPDTYRDAAVTNLFYWNNRIHDVMYHYGFDEASGNFQTDNFGNGGLGNDYVRAEAQDGSGTNNANFGTPSDGSRPRMQMFVWTAPALVRVNGGALAGDYTAGTAGFGAQLDAIGVTGDVELGDDGTGVPNDGCEPFVGFTPGKIAIVDRGACNFTVKAKNAQNAGAIGVIIANNQATGAINLGGADPTVVIPAVSLSLEDDALVKASLPLNVTMRKQAVNRDSDFDNGVIVHEYGHGISNRLTGGPATAACLGNAEQMGEGWSDYFALLLTQNGEDGRGIGTYVTFQPTTGPGIRPYVYSTSMATNPMTYDYIKDDVNISQPHGIGSVWATMLNDMTQDLVGRYGYDPDIVGGSGGNNVSLQLVTDGLKLQACRPGFVDGRNAILAADAIRGGANECLIWDAFARRGLGFSADQGSSNNRFDGTEAFDLPVSCCTFATLQSDVAALGADGTLNRGQTNSLLKKVQNAEKKVAQGVPHAAINMLNAFINEVAALKRLSAEQKEALTNCALGIINRTQQDFPGVSASQSSEFAGPALNAVAENLPEEFALDPGYPNPFNTTTNIRLALPEASQVRMAVYDLTGSMVMRLVDGSMSAGYHDVVLDGRQLSSGIYFVRVEAGAFMDVQRVVLIK